MEAPAEGHANSISESQRALELRKYASLRSVLNFLGKTGLTIQQTPFF
jgi:hypothetical protein